MAYSTLIDAHALSGMVQQRAVLVCDCRFDLADPTQGHVSFRAGHVPGAVYLNLDRDLSGPPTGSNGRHPLPERAQFAARMAALGLDAGRQVVAYDTSGGYYAARLWWLLRWAGHEPVAVLDGGLAAWTEAGLPLETGEPAARAAGTFAPSTAPAMPSLDAAAIEANLAGGQSLVIDARSPERFRGEAHPLDPVSGHIPGARNRFFQHNLTGQGRFKDPSELAREFGEVIDGFSPAQIVHQCGSGVTATHNLLAMEIAGLGGSGLYPGSWSEWVSGADRPIVTGAD